VRTVCQNVTHSAHSLRDITLIGVKSLPFDPKVAGLCPAGVDFLPVKGVIVIFEIKIQGRTVES
jgi:hypothetical protein